VLSGKGVIRRTLPPFANYRIAVSLDLRQAEAAELHFDVQPATDGEESRRYAIRVTRDQASLVERVGDRGTAETKGQAITIAKPQSGADEPLYRELRVERRGSQWWAFYDGKRLGVVPASADLPEFRLVTEDGPANFDSLEVAELVPPAE
jgi:hypothetical protein